MFCLFSDFDEGARYALNYEKRGKKHDRRTQAYDNDGYIQRLDLPPLGRETNLQLVACHGDIHPQQVVALQQGD